MKSCFIEKRDGRSRIVRRQSIYEKDRLDPVDTTTVLHLDPDLLARFQEGYRHLGYLQSKNGFTIRDDLPGLRGAAVEKGMPRGKPGWLVPKHRAMHITLLSHAMLEVKSAFGVDASLCDTLMENLLSFSLTNPLPCNRFSNRDEEHPQLMTSMLISPMARSYNEQANFAEIRA